MIVVVVVVVELSVNSAVGVVVGLNGGAAAHNTYSNQRLTILLNDL